MILVVIRNKSELRGRICAQAFMYTDFFQFNTYVTCFLFVLSGEVPTDSDSDHSADVSDVQVVNCGKTAYDLIQHSAGHLHPG